jgi:hypothetical protein
VSKPHFKQERKGINDNHKLSLVQLVQKLQSTQVQWILQPPLTEIPWTVTGMKHKIESDTKIIEF